MDPVVMFKEGGPFMYAIVAWALVGWLPAVVAAGLAAFRFRVPAAVWVLGPVVLLLIGAIGTWQGLTMADEAVAHASAEMRSTMAAAGISVAMFTDVWARALASALFLATAWLAAIAHPIGGGPRARWTLLHAATAVGLALPVVLAVGGAGIAWEMPIGGGVVALITLVGCLAMGIVALRGVDPWQHTDDDDALAEARSAAPRLAAARVLVALCAVAAVWMAGTVVEQIGIVQAFEAAAHAPAELKGELLARGLDMAGDARWLGAMGAVGLALAGLASTVPLAEHLGHWRTGLGIALLALLFLPLAGLWVVQGSTADGLQDLVGSAEAAPR